MGSPVLLTVDTELLWSHYSRGLGWEENLARSYDAAGVGVPYQLQRLAEHGLKACFFVDPMPALLYGLEPIRRMVEPVLAAGQEVQLHLHSFWVSAAEGRPPAEFELTCFDADRQRELIVTARDLLIAAGAPEPIAFRSGSYAANEPTLAALQGLGFRYDSSHNGSQHPWPSALPLDPRLVVPVRCGGIVEIPVSQIEDRRGRLRHMQLCALSTAEMKAALLHAARGSHPVTTIVSHSFELATRDGQRVNRVLRRRFDALCEFLAAQRGALPTVHFGDLEALSTDAEGSPLPPSLLRRTHRMAEQFWANAAYERAL